VTSLEPGKRRRAVARLLSDLERLSCRESLALSRPDFSELETIQEKKAMLIQALSRHVNELPAGARADASFRLGLRRLIDKARDNRQTADGIFQSMVEEAGNTASVSRRLQELHGSYLAENVQASRLLTTG
jgi:hypothetical protein